MRIVNDTEFCAILPQKRYNYKKHTPESQKIQFWWMKIHHMGVSSEHLTKTNSFHKNKHQKQIESTLCRLCFTNHRLKLIHICPRKLQYLNTAIHIPAKSTYQPCTVYTSEHSTSGNKATYATVTFSSVERFGLRSTSIFTKFTWSFVLLLSNIISADTLTEQTWEPSFCKDDTTKQRNS